jgi:hypothetical protein
MPTYEPDSERRRRLAFWLYPHDWPTSEEQENLARALLDPRRDASTGSYDPFGNSIGSFGPAPPSSSPPPADDWEHRTPIDPSGAPFLPTDPLPEGDQSNVGSGDRGAWGAGAKWIQDGGNMHAAGVKTLTENPLLSILWQPTHSAWTSTAKNERGGFSDGVKNLARPGGIQVADEIWPAPPGSYGKGDGLSQGKANNVNGLLAENAVAQWFRDQGYRVREQVRLSGRRPDVVALQPAEGVIGGVEKRAEVKVGDVTLNRDIRRQIGYDRRALDSNRALRHSGEADWRTGRLLRGVGRVALPVSVGMDVYDLTQAHAADGNRIGENTRRAASGVAGGAAGGWVGAQAGLALGAPFGPPGWIVGPIAGGLLGAWGGSSLGHSVYDQLRHPGRIPTTSLFDGAP